MHYPNSSNKINPGNLSLLISLVTSPSTESSSDFFERYFDSDDSPIFAGYKRTLASFFKKEDTYNDNSYIDDLLYRPNGYLLFGKFDLLLLTLTDDIEFATRNFRPYSTCDVGEEFKPINFDYQVFSTITPDVNSESFIQKFQKVTEDKFVSDNPFVSITQLKLNPSLLIGNGILFLSEVLSKIDVEINGVKTKLNNFDLDYLYEINLGSHEIVLILFSSSTVLISNAIFKIREISFTDFKDEFKLNSALFEFADEEVNDISVMNNHIFVDSISNFGISLKYISRVNDFGYDSEIDFSNLFFSTKWFVKPGHFLSASSCISDELKKINENIEVTPMLTLGRGDMILQAQIDFKSDHDFFMKYIGLLNCKSDLINHHIRESITSISFKIESGATDESSKLEIKNFRHKILMDKWLIERCSVAPQELNIIVNNLKKINAPKILAEKITSICNIFNNVIQDPVLFGSFIELEPYIKLQIIKKIELASNPHDIDFIQKKSSSQWFKELRDNSIIFEHAFYDRFFQTHRTADLTDINLDYKGAIHQLLSTYDALFKFYSYQLRLNTKAFKYTTTTFRKKFYKMLAPQVVYISDLIGIRSTKNSLRINQQHLFQPYIYLSVFIHEVCNFSLHSFMRALNKSDKESYNTFSKYFNAENFPNKHLYVNKTDNVNVKDIIKQSLNDPFLNDHPYSRRAIKNIFEKHDDALAYLYVDTFTFSITFNGNIEQYSYWHLQYMLFQANNLHEGVHKISYDVYAIIYFRLFIVYLMSGNSIDEELYDKFVRWTPDFYIKKNKKNKYRDSIKEISIAAKFVYDNHNLREFFDTIKYFNKEVYTEFDFDDSLDKIHISYSKDNDDELTDFKNRVDSFTEMNIDDDMEYKSKLLDVIRHYIYIFHAYNGFHSNNKLFTIIERDKDSGVVAISDNNKDKLNEFADFCFDSQGGMFTTSAVIRKKIHLARSYVFIALWDFTQKYKKFYF